MQTQHQERRQRSKRRMTRYTPFNLSSLMPVSLVLMLSSSSLSTLQTANAFVSRPRPRIHWRTSVNYRSTIEQEVEAPSSTAAPLAVESFQGQSSYLWDDDIPRPKNGERNGRNGYSNGQKYLSTTELAEKLTDTCRDPALVEFVPSEEYQDQTLRTDLSEINGGKLNPDDSGYPFAAMLQGSAPYIASHLGETAVFYIPGEWLHKPNKLFDSFLQDVALARLMGMKIVLVADCRMETDGGCSEYSYAHECHNIFRPTPQHTIRQIEEEAGYVRFEVERKLNRFFKTHLVCGEGEQEGNVIGGNFYQARTFGKVRGEDFEHTGFVQQVYTDNIRKSLDNNDVVLLTTVGCSPKGDSVNVNGHHLAASVAASLNAYKLIYMSNQGSVLSQKDDRKFFQEIPLSFAKDLCDYHKVKAHNTGFANFEQARQTLAPRAVELLLNLAWSAWAIDQGVTRAHIVNPKDGALLEELFTSKNGANTCLYHDDELLMNDEDSWLSDEDADDWNDFFAEAAAQEGSIKKSVSESN